MANPKNNSHQSSTYAVIRENALVLSLDKPDTPVVARFDLDSLAQANFIVQAEGTMHKLVLRDFSGSERLIAQFNNKIDAHQALQHILQALVSHNTPAHHAADKKCTIGRVGGWVLKALGIIFILLAVLIGFQLLATRSPVESEFTSKVQTTMPSTILPEGQPMDIDGLFTQPPSQQAQ
jgi:hypothetical protein